MGALGHGNGSFAPLFAASSACLPHLDDPPFPFLPPPGCVGAVRPEKRVTARSNAPQKKWTGLTLPRKAVRNSPNTASIRTSAR